MLAVLSFLLATTITTIAAREEIVPSIPWKQVLQRWKEKSHNNNDSQEGHTEPDDQDEGECDCEEPCEESRKKEHDCECDPPEECED